MALRFSLEQVSQKNRRTPSSTEQVQVVGWRPSATGMPQRAHPSGWRATVEPP